MICAATLRFARHAARILCVAGALWQTCALAENLDDCKKLDEGSARLACYDHVLGYQKQPPAVIAPAAIAPASAATNTTSVVAPAGKPQPTRPQRREDRCAVAGSGKTASVAAPDAYTLYQQWDLDGRERGLTDLMAYRPNYAIFRHSDAVNEAPTSPADGRSVTVPESFQYTELKFQLSFKSELLSPLWFCDMTGSNRWRFWLAYTQQSNWQIFNGPTSRPFRNTNYEPEAIVSYRYSGENDSPALPRLMNLAFAHQSNGQSNPKSRSWNRVYLQGGWQLNDYWSIMARTWYRLPDSDDDNPDIQQYLGRGDAVVRYGRGPYTWQLLARNTFHANHNREFLQFDFTFNLPHVGPKLFLQLTSGFGESLIDYNFRQKTIGLGLSFDLW